MGTEESEFAPAERADDASILHDAKVLSKAGLIEHVTHVIPTVLLVLNEERQVVYKNQQLMDVLAVSTDLEILGKRPGELFHCIHSRKNINGCGTTAFCRECGAVRAILKSQSEQVGVEEECRIVTTSGEAMDFRVWASPYICDGSNYTLLTLQDISDEKRREVYERIFFHDINNILCVIVGHSDLLELEEDKEKSADSLAVIQWAAKELQTEIETHKILVAAENGNLSVELDTQVNSRGLLKDLVSWSNRAWDGRPAIHVESTSDFVIPTNYSLLFRVLYNMVKNAFEASNPSAVISIRATQASGNGVFSVHNPEGMARSTQLQIFQRSFSTKGKGRGLGTYSMKLFAEGFLGGKVWFSSSKEKGTTFFVSIPQVAPERKPRGLVVG